MAEKISTNPREFPEEKMPNFILKAKNGHFHFMMKEPDVSKNYLWYMSEPKLITMAELEQEMSVPGRRWYATDRAAYELQKKLNAVTAEGTPYVCLRKINTADLYYFGPRHAEPPAEAIKIVATVAELYLKSEVHRKRLIRLLLENIQRVLKNPQVFRNGDTMVEIRKEMPTPEQIKLLSLLPGIAKIYYGVRDETHKGDPRGEWICDGAGGIPILPDQPALALISGGIDSPVAAYRMMTRGCHVRGVHFLNSTNDTAAVMQKNRKLAETLSRIQGRFDMHYVDISSLQTQIVAHVPNHNRTLIYKYVMLALAADMDDSKFIVTGDSAGQVASQTVANISTLYPSIKKAVVSPLIGLSKRYIIDEARNIDTYELSILEGADCCQYMMCKTGANLCMGRRVLLACLSHIKLTELRVTKELYRDGALVETSEYMYTPEADCLASARKSGPTRKAAMQKALATNGHKTAEEPVEEVEDDDDDEEDHIYFDAAAGTKMTFQVKRALLNAPEGNPSSMHASGRAARMAVEKVRNDLAKALHVPATDIIFTAGGTESNNIALHGYRVVRDAWSHASTSEHHDAADGAVTVRVIDLVNHETGSITKELKRPPGGRLHLDASQALTKIDFSSLDLSEVDSITVTAHKINGPVGAGAVYLRNLDCHKLYSGGSQEKGIRPGTENVPAIVAFGVALGLDRSLSVHHEIDAFIVEELVKLGCEVNRRGEVSGYIVHATLPDGYDNTEVVTRLSVVHKVEIGTGSACKTGEVNTTVYDTLGKAAAPTRSVRLSWDSFATMHEAEKVVEAMKKVLRELKPKNSKN